MRQVWRSFSQGPRPRPRSSTACCWKYREAAGRASALRSDGRPVCAARRPPLSSIGLRPSAPPWRRGAGKISIVFWVCRRWPRARPSTAAGRRSSESGTAPMTARLAASDPSKQRGRSCAIPCVARGTKSSGGERSGPSSASRAGCHPPVRRRSRGRGPAGRGLPSTSASTQGAVAASSAVASTVRRASPASARRARPSTNNLRAPRWFPWARWCQAAAIWMSP